MNSRTNDPNGSTAAAALGANNEPKPANGPPLLVVVAAAGAVWAERPSSRRVTANADHISGPAAVLSPVPPVVSHDNRFAPIPPTDAAAAAGGMAIMPGALVVVAAAATVITGPVERDPDPVSPPVDSAVDEPTTVVVDGDTACAGSGPDTTAGGSTATGAADADPEWVGPVGVLTGAVSGSGATEPRWRGVTSTGTSNVGDPWAPRAPTATGSAPAT